MERLLAVLALFAYLAPLVGRVLPRAQSVLGHRAWTWAGAGLHAGALVVAALLAGTLPLDSMRWTLEALSLWVVLGWLFLQRQPRMELLGAMLSGTAIVLLSVAQVAPSAGASSPLDSLWLPTHLTLILLGLCGFAVSFTLSVLFLVVRRRLKQKRLRGIARLPSLETLDRLNYRAMALGFVALTAGMAIGGTWAATHPDRAMGPDITVWGTVGLWLWYAAGLHVRLVSGWRGRAAAIFGVGGMVGLGGLVAVALVVLRGWHG